MSVDQEQVNRELDELLDNKLQILDPIERVICLARYAWREWERKNGGGIGSFTTQISRAIFGQNGPPSRDFYKGG
jgi:hypothetical protein